MPSKHHPSRMRTRTQSRELRQQPRAWGTRYDYLNTSPPPAQSSSPILSPTTSPTPHDSSEHLAHALSLELFGANAKPTEKRDWADDEVPPSLFSPGRPPVVLNLTGGPTPARKDIAKQPHNASVFVGSLPPDSDETQLAQHLAQHLSRFANVQNIKIVHDTKGGLCAFVQCENAVQAAQLVSQARADPQPFMGRYLRYENARARRTLWISYRTPMHFIPCASNDEDGCDVVVDENGVKGQWIESDLPDALRIYKPRDARFPTVTFRSDSQNVDDASRFEKDAFVADVAPAFRYKGVLFTDLKFDTQMIRRMTEAFGPLESFKTLVENSSGEGRCAYPAEHDSSRSSGMDYGVWEIKWEHRDDCITALNTLRPIPFLTVTWAKDSGPPQTPRNASLNLKAMSSPRYPAAHTSHETISPVARGRPFLLLDCRSGNDGEFSNVESSSTGSTFVRSPNVPSPQKDPLSYHKNVLVQRTQEDDAEEGWTVVRSQNMMRTTISTSSRNGRENLSISEETKGSVRDWSEGDFPPLKTSRTRSVEASRTEKKKTTTTSGDFASLDEAAPSKPEAGEEPVLEVDQHRDEPAISRPPLAHRRSLSNPVARLKNEAPHNSPVAQNIEIPPTPELANSSLTETPTSAQADLESPVYPAMMALAGADFVKQEQGRRQDDEGVAPESDQGIVDSAGTGRYDYRRQTTVDPKTIFVGGLEHFGTRPWDEVRLREVFGKYGEIQNIHVVSPSFKKAGFAFVTFTDEQSTKKAICEEHNRSYDGRQIRVQFRDMFPQRGFLKFRGRGIGRRQFLYDTHRDGMGRHNDFNGNAGRNPLLLANAGKPFDHYSPYSGRSQGGIAPFQVDPRGPYHLAPSASIGTDSSTLRSLNSFDSKTEVDVSHDSDSKTAASITPPPSTLNTSVSTPGVAAPIGSQTISSTQTGFYQPHTWVTPYGSQMHYPMACGTIGGVVPSVPMSFPSTNQSIDSGSVTGSMPMQWNPMYRPTISFAPYPYMLVPPASTEASRGGTVSSQPTTPVKGQPPLHATGFIQGDHGVLFPVYQPEALNNYMSSSSPTRDTVAQDISVTGSGTKSYGQPQSNVITAPMWHGFTHAPQFIAYSMPNASTMGVTPSATQPASNPQHSVHQQMQSHSSQAMGSSTVSSTMPSVTHLSHSVPVQGGHATFTVAGTSAQAIPPPYYIGAPPNNSAMSHAASHGNNGMHGMIPDRLNMYTNKQPPRRDTGHQQGRNGYHGRTHGSNIAGAGSPSAARPAGGPNNAPNYHHGNNHALQERQRQSSAAPSFQVGFNKDGGYSQQHHQWMGNFHQ